MPHGWKDYTMPVTVEAVTVETLPVDIKAQTIAMLKIDIAAQTLSQLNVNLAASAITLDVNIASSSTTLNVNLAACAVTLNVNISSSAVTLNVKTAVGEHVDADIVGSVTLNTDIVAQSVGNIGVDIKAQTLGQLNVNIAASAITLNVNIAASAVTLNVKTAVGEHVDTDIVSSITLKTDIAAQSVGYIGVDIKAQTLGQLNVNIAASAVTLNVNIASSAVTLNVNIASSSVTLNVNITSSSTTLNVNLASSAITLNVNIAAQTVDINVKTSGGANIVIDKLTQSAYTARVDTLAWNGTSPIWFAPTGVYRRGKLFPRGARGFMRNIGVYCRDAGTAGGTVYVYISPAPYLGPVYSGTITVPAAGGADWRNWTVEKMWNYDSLFIWAYTSSSDIQLAYDNGGPDCFVSTDEGSTWTGHPSARFWLRAEVQGMTVGDIPVSGTVNTVEIPVTALGTISGIISIPANEAATLITVEGPGENLHLHCWSDNSNMRFKIECDGQRLKIGGSDYFATANLYLWGYSASTPGISLLKYNATEGYDNLFTITIPFKWKSKIVISATNISTASRNASVSLNYSKALG